MPDNNLVINADGTLVLSGILTVDTVSILWRQSLPLISSGRVQRIDLAAVSHSDSAGLALLLEWLRQAKKSALDLQFINFPPQLRAIATGANVQHFFNI